MAEKTVKKSSKKSKDSTAEVVVESSPSTEVDAPEGDYAVLYQQFRPRRFSEVVGQEQVTDTLRSMVINKKVPHGILFTGLRGSGKTTSARLLAMALNCEALEDGEPCGECVTCTGVIEGSPTLGVTEIDAASNRSIDGIREVISMMHAASVATVRVFIIDEVHQLTKEAASAFLKTLEEPPHGVVIILATTDPEKMLPTIKSRVTQFKFNAIPQGNMEALVKSVAARAGMEVTKKQIASVILQGRGSARDTLSALEALRSGAGVDYSDIAREVTDALVDNNISDVLAAISKGADEGRSALDMSDTLLAHWRDCLIAKVAPSTLRYTDETLDALAADAEAIGVKDITRLLKRVADATSKMAYSSDGKLILEVALIQSVSDVAKSEEYVIDAVEDAAEDILDFMERLNDKVDALILASPDVTWPATGKKDKKGKAADAAESDDTDEDDESDDEPPAKPSKAPKNDAETPAKESKPGKKDKKSKGQPVKETGEEFLDRLYEVAGKKLKIVLDDDDTEAEFDGNVFVLTTGDDIKEALFKELEALVTNQGYDLKHETRD